MYRHPFDPISFFFGLVFTVGALSALFVDDPWPFGRARLWPIMLIAGGLALLVAALRSGSDRKPVEATIPAATATAGADPLLIDARREIDEYVGEAVPSDDATDVVTAEVVTEGAGSKEIDGDEAVTAEVDEATLDDSHPSGEPGSSEDESAGAGR